MTFYPRNPRIQALLQSDIPGVSVIRAFLALLTWTAAQAVAASNNGVLGAQTGGSQVVATTGITNPPAPRNLTVTYGGTALDIKGGHQVTAEGTDYAGNTITETLPAATVDTAGTVVGTKAFKTVTKLTIPAHDGAGATTSVGWGDKLGLPFKLDRNTVQAVYLNKAMEGTDPTVATSTTDLSNNTIDLASPLNGTQVDVYLAVP